MIKITSPSNQALVIKLLNNKTFDHYTFNYKYKKNINLYFEVNGNQKQAAHLAKAIIENSTYGKAIFFNVTVE